MRSRNIRVGFFVTKASRLGLVTAALLFHACGGRSDDSPRAIAEEAYVFAFPLLESYKMLFALSLFEGSGAYAAPPNVLSHTHELLDADFTVIVRPNNDTFYSGVWLLRPTNASWWCSYGRTESCEAPMIQPFSWRLQKSSAYC